jgi:hypothetical protein
MSPTLKLGLVDAIKTTISASHKNKLIRKQAEKCLNCKLSSSRDIRVMHNGGSVKEPTEIGGFTYAEKFNYYLPNQGYRGNNFQTPNVYYPYRDPINLRKANISWDDIDKSYRNNTELTCAIKNADLAIAIRNARDSCLNRISEQMKPIVEKASIDALKVAGAKVAAGGITATIAGTSLRGCDAKANYPSYILFPECEWEESFNVVERRADIFVDGERIRFDEPIVSGPCPINVVPIITPGEYRLSVKTFKMKGFDAVTLNGLLAPEPGPPDPWRNHVPITDWREIVPPLEEDQQAFPGQRKQIPTYWGSSELGASNFRNVGGLSPVANLNEETALAGLDFALKLLDALSAPAFFAWRAVLLSTECALEQVFGSSDSNIY